MGLKIERLCEFFYAVKVFIKVFFIKVIRKKNILKKTNSSHSSILLNFGIYTIKHARNLLLQKGTKVTKVLACCCMYSEKPQTKPWIKNFYALCVQIVCVYIFSLLHFFSCFNKTHHTTVFIFLLLLLVGWRIIQFVQCNCILFFAVLFFFGLDFIFIYILRCIQTNILFLWFAGDVWSLGHTQHPPRYTYLIFGLLSGFSVVCLSFLLVLVFLDIITMDRA